MKKIIFILLLISFTASAEEIKTRFFTLDLPESLKVEKGTGTILIFGHNGPYSKPFQFMSIEYGTDADLDRLIAGANKTLSEHKDGASVNKVSCPNKCIAYFGSVRNNESKNGVNTLFYIIKGETVTAIISYGYEGDYAHAKLFIDAIAGQIIEARKIK